ncbi:transcriptional regulator GutM [Amphibacillus jilinensis]|uniref:transcriptional regulator GutM n=1 Tax=Amphibacillus jilinensis TaxID=1216008 RepID=UPI0002E575B6|nr:transcriptional regulator GutM [Amphibacillus jilinensis]
MLWPLLVLIGASWLLQSLLGFMQIRHFNRKYSELRSLGRVVIGKKTGLFKAGTVVMFAIDDQNTILKASKMQGTTVFSRVKAMKGYSEKSFLNLKNESLAKEHKLTRLAIHDAISNFDIIRRGGELQVKKTWLDHLFSKKLKV